MGNIQHGEAHKDSGARTEKERFYCHPHPRRSRDTRFAGRYSGYKPKRIDRAICQRANEGRAAGRGSATGGILRQLIARCRIRLAKLEDQVKEQIDEIYLLESALEKVENIPDKT